MRCRLLGPDDVQLAWLWLILNLRKIFPLVLEEENDWLDFLLEKILARCLVMLLELLFLFYVLMFIVNYFRFRILLLYYFFSSSYFFFLYYSLLILYFLLRLFYCRSLFNNWRWLLLFKYCCWLLCLINLWVFFLLKNFILLINFYIIDLMLKLFIQKLILLFTTSLRIIFTFTL